MCRKHLLGEHVETHMIVGSLNRGKDLRGFYAKGLIDTSRLQGRHDALVYEMLKRGFNHTSDLDDFMDPEQGSITDGALDDLIQRCPLCRHRYEQFIAGKDTPID